MAPQATEIATVAAKARRVRLWVVVYMGRKVRSQTAIVKTKIVALAAHGE